MAQYVLFFRFVEPDGHAGPQYSHVVDGWDISDALALFMAIIRNTPLYQRNADACNTLRVDAIRRSL